MPEYLELARSCTGIFATCTTCEKTTGIFLEYFCVFYPCFTQDESSRLWKVDIQQV